MTLPESDLIPLSALQHLLFCERQCALIHLEREWVENRLTTEGHILHRKAHDGKPKTRDGVRITRGLPLRSFQLGVSGQSDVIEWRPPPAVDDRQTDQTLAEFLKSERSSNLIGWTITPVEYKRGSPKSNDCDRVQLCAQAICLEEMLGVEIGDGQIFYGSQRRRVDVTFNSELRRTTIEAADRLQRLFASGRTPPAAREKKCDSCSLISVCLPDVTEGRRSARRFFEKQLTISLSSIEQSEDEDMP